MENIKCPQQKIRENYEGNNCLLSTENLSLKFMWNDSNLKPQPVILRTKS